MKVYSTSKWEASYFGGHEKVLYDYPEIRLSMDVNYRVSPEFQGTLSYYTRGKLIKMFLLRVNENNLTELITRGGKIVEPKWASFRKTKEYVFNPAQVRTALDMVTEKESELRSLFEEFRDLILATEFSVDVNEDGNGKGKGDGDGDEEDNEDEQEGKDPTKQQTNEAIEALNDTKQYQFRYASGESLSGDLKKRTTFKMVSKTPKPVEYSKDETIMASRLVKMLDINFDPKSDKVNNLKTGKLNVSKIAEVPAGNSHVYYRVEERQTTRPFSVCILADESGSMAGDKANKQNSFLKVLYKAFSEILPPDRIYIYGHSGIDDPEIRVYHDKYNHCFEETINRQLHNRFYENYDGPVIESIHEKVRSMTDDSILFISISDGEPAGRGYGGSAAILDLKRVIEKCKRDNFVTVGIGLAYNMMKSIYSYHIIVNNLSQLVKQASSLINGVVKLEFQD